MEKKLATATFWANGIRMGLELGRYEDGRLAITGECEGAIGQCQDSIALEAGDDSEELNAVLTIWEENHLKVTPDSIFDRAAELIRGLNGKRLGDAPDVDDAPDIGGDIFDSRDAVKRLEIYRAAVIQIGIPDDEADSFDQGEKWPASAPDDLTAEESEIVEEFLKVRSLCDEGENYSEDWSFGATVIAESYFTEYAEDLCKDIGDVPDDIPGYLAIDWEKTAENLKVDYTEIEYDGDTYLVR